MRLCTCALSKNARIYRYVFSALFYVSYPRVVYMYATASVYFCYKFCTQYVLESSGFQQLVSTCRYSSVVVSSRLFLPRRRDVERYFCEANTCEYRADGRKGGVPLVIVGHSGTDVSEYMWDVSNTCLQTRLYKFKYTGTV